VAKPSVYPWRPLDETSWATRPLTWDQLRQSGCLTPSANCYTWQRPASRLTRTLPRDLAASLPTIEEIEAELSGEGTMR
jgi:hypothetical protein